MLTNTNTLQTLTNEGKIDNGSNSGTIDNFTNQNTNAANPDNGHILNFTNAQGGTITTFDNQAGQVDAFTNQNGGTITTWTNNTNGNVTALTNAGNVTTLSNANNAQLATLTNQGTITTGSNEGTITAFTNTGTFTTLTNNTNATITTLTNDGTFTTLTNDGTLTTLTHNANATLNTLSNQGTLSTLNLASSITNYTNNATNTTTTLNTNGTKDTSFFVNFTNTAGTINTNNTDLFIHGLGDANGAFNNAETIDASGKTIDIWGTFSNTGTITADTIILGRNPANPAAWIANTNGAHIGGTINAGNNNATQLELKNWVLELTQKGGGTQRGGDYNTNLGNATGDNTKGHILVNENVNLSEIRIDAHFNDDGSIKDQNAGILILATQDKWGEKYNYQALFLKRTAQGQNSTLINTVQDENGNTVGKTDDYGQAAAGQATGYGGNTTVKIEALKHLYTPQSTTRIIDLLDGFALGIEPQGSPVESLSAALLNGTISKNILIGNLIDAMSRRMFHNSLSHRQGKTYVVTSRSVDEEGKRIKDDENVEVPLVYSNIDLLHETDLIYAPHAKDSNHQSFIIPFSRYTRTDLGQGYIGSEFSGGALLGTFKNLDTWGNAGIYLGYEQGKATLPRSTGEARVNNSSILVGGTYYKTFYTSGMREYYMKLSLHAQIQSPEFELYLNALDISAINKLSAYGAEGEFKIGANFFRLFNNSYISPEIGIGYGIFALNAFTLNYPSEFALDESYPAHLFHLPYVSLQVRYTKAFTHNARYSFSLGGRYTLKDTHTTTLQIGPHNASSLLHLPPVMGTGSAGLYYSLGKRSELSLQVDGTFAQERLSAGGSLRYAIWF